MAFFRTTQVSQGTHVSVQLPVAIIQEGDAYVAYTPALDLSTSGSSKKEAIEMFNEAVRIFFEDLIENRTAEQVLPGLGWTKDLQKSSWVPPKISQESVGVKIPTFA